jgi:hypothetical protein
VKDRFGLGGAIFCLFWVFEAGFERSGKSLVGVSNGRGVMGWLLWISRVDLVRSRKLGGKRSSWCWDSRGRGRIPVVSWLLAERH